MISHPHEDRATLAGFSSTPISAQKKSLIICDLLNQRVNIITNVPSNMKLITNLSVDLKGYHTLDWSIWPQHMQLPNVEPLA